MRKEWAEIRAFTLRQAPASGRPLPQRGRGDFLTFAVSSAARDGKDVRQGLRCGSPPPPHGVQPELPLEDSDPGPEREGMASGGLE